jgi:hypothetical protein
MCVSTSCDPVPQSNQGNARSEIIGCPMAAFEMNRQNALHGLTLTPAILSNLVTNHMHFGNHCFDCFIAPFSIVTAVGVSILPKSSIAVCWLSPFHPLGSFKRSTVLPISHKLHMNSKIHHHQDISARIMFSGS